MDELDEVFDTVAAYFGVLSEPMRLRIVRCICHEEKSVNQIVEELGATQTNVSRHLSLMYRSKLLARRKAGNRVYYSIADPEMVEICRSVCTRIAARIEDRKPVGRSLLKLMPQPGSSRQRASAARKASR